MTCRAVVSLAIVTLVAWVGLADVAHSNAVEQKPVRQSTFHVDGVEAPASLDSLWNMATLIIAGTVVEVRDASEAVYPLGSTEPATLPQTIYVVEVQRVFKSDGRVSPNATIEVRRLGGVVDRGAFLENRVDANFPGFKAHKKYVLFLRSRDANSPYAPVAGADSAFELGLQGVVPFGRGAASRQLANLNSDGLFALLQKEGGR
jgi:hypothetical protein